MLRWCEQARQIRQDGPNEVDYCEVTNDWLLENVVIRETLSVICDSLTEGVRKLVEELYARGLTLKICCLDDEENGKTFVEELESKEEYKYKKGTISVKVGERHVPEALGRGLYVLSSVDPYVVDELLGGHLLDKVPGGFWGHDIAPDLPPLVGVYLPEELLLR